MPDMGHGRDITLAMGILPQRLAQTRLRGSPPRSEGSRTQRSPGGGRAAAGRARRAPDGAGGSRPCPACPALRGCPGARLCSALPFRPPAPAKTRKMTRRYRRMLHMLNTDTDTMQNISVSLNTFKDRYTCHTGNIC
ncbi:hypothetical protein DV515_00004563, partial [Chloebia gouldiae]